MTGKLGSALVVTTCFIMFLACSVLGQKTLPTPSATPIAVRGMSPEEWGDEASAAGKYESAMRNYSQQWLSWAAGYGEAAPETQIHRERLAGKMSKALAKLSKPPEIPDRAVLHGQKGASFLDKAKSVAEGRKSVAEYQDAVNSAPWVFEYQYGLAVTLWITNQYKVATNYARIAKILATNDKDRQSALKLQAEIEAEIEMPD